VATSSPSSTCCSVRKRRRTEHFRPSQPAHPHRPRPIRRALSDLASARTPDDRDPASGRIGPRAQERGADDQRRPQFRCLTMPCLASSGGDAHYAQRAVRQPRTSVRRSKVCQCWVAKVRQGNVAASDCIGRPAIRSRHRKRDIVACAKHTAGSAARQSDARFPSLRGESADMGPLTSRLA
jgi:hypothetical protein